MDLARNDAEEAVRRTVSDLMAAQCPIDRVRKAEPLGYDAELWSALDDLGVAEGAALTALAVGAEEVGRSLAPVPFIDVTVARRLLDRLDGSGGSGCARPTLAVRPAVSGVARLVPSGAVATHVLALRGDELVVTAHDEDPLGVPSTLGSAPLADRVVEGEHVSVLARGPSATSAYDRAVDEWRVLTAAALVGLAQGAFDLALERVRARQQFGVAIGTFQVVQHRLADLATDLDGARLLCWEAAWHGELRDERAPALASMAFLFASEVATRIATESLHLHGGFGFTLDGDIQLYFRRAKAWPLTLEDPEHELARLGDLLYAGDS